MRTNDPEATRQNIIEVAYKEFAENGLAGARIDEIAAKTKSSKRMIYYYFGGKEGLYIKVLEEAYTRIRGIERSLDLAHLPPREALEKLVRVTFDHHDSNPDFVRLVMNENIHNAAYLAKSPAIQKLTLGLRLRQRRGHLRRRDGLFRRGLGSVDSLAISALCFFNVSPSG